MKIYIAVYDLSTNKIYARVSRLTDSLIVQEVNQPGKYGNAGQPDAYEPDNQSAAQSFKVGFCGKMFVPRLKRCDSAFVIY